MNAYPGYAAHCGQRQVKSKTNWRVLKSHLKNATSNSYTLICQQLCSNPIHVFQLILTSMMISAFLNLPLHDESLTSKTNIIKIFHSEIRDNLFKSNFSSSLKVKRNLRVNFLKKKLRQVHLRSLLTSIFFLQL